LTNRRRLRADRKGIDPYAIYLILQFCAALIFSLIFTVNMLYQVTIVGLSPLQLVLVGTILETSVFVFEIPTGVLADVKSRRLSVIVGYFLVGAGFIVEGSLPVFWAVALAQVVWGVGYTFTSGATEAWVADEVGEARAGAAFLRGSQARMVGALVAIPLSVAIGTLDVRLPILTGGALLMGLGLFLALFMTEKGFVPTPPGERTTWGMMIKTMRDARLLVRRQPVLLLLLAIGIFYGLYSEGFDRLWTAHLLEDFASPFWDRVQPVVWLGGIRAVSMLGSLVATEMVRRRVNTERSASLALVLMFNAGVIVVALAGFSLVESFGFALVFFWLVGIARSLIEPLQTTWYNLSIDDPQVRATTFSVSSQVDALGQIAGGPGVGLIGNASIRAALMASAALLLPVIPFYGVAKRRIERGVNFQEVV
jgi:DHA3 family tetracycline resistance protein-like MFS transporter